MESDRNSFENSYALLMAAQNKSNDLVETLKKKKDIIDQNVHHFRHLIREYHPLSDNQLLKKKIVSVDGSNQLIEINPQIVYVPISVAVIYQNYKDNSVENSIYPYIETIRVLDEEGHAKVEDNDSFVQFYGTITEDIKRVEQSVGSNVNALMIKYETDALFRIIDNINTGKIDVPSVLFLDGPLIDPPIDGLISTIRARCDAFNQLKEKGVCIVGVTKRIFQRYYLDHLKNNYYTDPNVMKFLNCVYGDSDLMNSIFNNLPGITKPVFSNTYNMFQLNISQTNASMKEYLAYREYDVDFDSCFFMNTWNPIKLDLLLPERSSELQTQVLDCVAKLSYPGLSIPFPVFLAHNSANIKIEMAELLKRIILSGVTSKIPGFVLTNIIQNFYDII